MRIEKSTAEFLDIFQAFNLITEKIADYKEDLEKLLKTILGHIVSMLNISYASIMLLDEKQSQFHPVSTYGDLPIALDLKENLDVSKLMGCSVAIGQNVVFADLVDDSEWARLKPEERQCLEEMLCSPLVIHEKIIGVACIYGKDLDIGILESKIFYLWVNLTSLAIEKSRFHNYNHKMDITREDLKQTQSQLIRSEKLNSLAEIAMSVGHTIRNPVTVIGGLSRLIYKDLPEEDPKRLWSQMIISEASRLESIVREFNHFFSIEQISFLYLDINHLVNEAADHFLSQFHAKPDFTLKLKIWNEPLICSVDPNLLERCLIHLLANARESNGNGIEITLATSQAGSHAYIDVIDSGKGMSQKEINRVFAPFYTTKGEGAGMGLTFVHFVICEHSGQIDITSEKGEGTRFRIILPLESPQ
ncbi:MAG: GAF domain-containing protein [Desulfobacteraceae bacterium]|nr:GAF domain-containing protein [Desulfobacteraceae bacterium]